jgi:hypothetical protein
VQGSDFLRWRDATEDCVAERRGGEVHNQGTYVRQAQHHSELQWQRHVERQFRFADANRELGTVPSRDSVTYYSGAFGEGTIFKMKGSIFTLLHNFNCASDGCYPVGASIEDTKGNLYGTAFYSGSLRVGTVWKLTP